MTIKSAKKVSPFFTKAIYLYALPLPVLLLVLMGHEGMFYDLIIIRFCVAFYVLSVVIIGLGETDWNEGGR